VAGGEAIMLGEAPVPMDILGQNILFAGAIGTGKTNAILTVLGQLVSKGKKGRFWDAKGEARRLPLYFPNARVFTPCTAAWQPFQVPTGVDPMAFGIGVITEIRIGADLRSETFPLLYSIWDRIVRGLRPGDPWPSVSDFRREVHDEAEQQFVPIEVRNGDGEPS
jgi:hypothetical protein